MSQETMEFLNSGNILVNGSVIMPWWQDQEMIDFLVHTGRMARSPIYDGMIPLDDVSELFSEVISGYMTAALKELGEDEAPTLFYADGSPFAYNVAVAEAFKLVGPLGRDVFFECFKAGYDTENHQFRDTLLAATSAILGEDLGIITAGKLRDGAQGFVSVGLGETFVTTVGGVEYDVHLTAAGSFNGKIATQWVIAQQVAVCDNTLNISLSQGAKSGRVAKVKHTKHSRLGIADARAALDLIDLSAQSFADDVSTLLDVAVQPSEWNLILDALVPVPEESGRGKTMAATKRETLQSLYTADDRVTPWSGTAFGVLQAFNTYGQHEAIVRGANRVERNYENAITGKIAESDAMTLAVIAEVCNRKELVLA